MIKKNLGYIISTLVLLICLFWVFYKVSENRQLELNTSSTSTIREQTTITETEPKTNSKRIHNIQKGDTLWDLSVRYYGDGTKYIEIIKKNPGKTFKFLNGREGLIYPGTELEI